MRERVGAPSSRHKVEALDSTAPVDPDSLPQQPIPQPDLQDGEAQVVIQAIDVRSGTVLWQVPAGTLPALSDELARAASEAGPASYRDPAPSETRDPAKRCLGLRAYETDERPLPPPGRISRTI